MCLRCIFLCSPVFARCYASATFAVMRCLSVCPSACFCLSRSWILSKPINISSLFSPSGSHTVLVFFSHVKRYSNIPTGTPFRGGGVERRLDMHKLRFSMNIWLSIDELVECEQLRPSTVQFTAQTLRISESLCITTSMDDHDEEKRREFICKQR